MFVETPPPDGNCWRQQFLGALSGRFLGGVMPEELPENREMVRIVKPQASKLTAVVLWLMVGAAVGGQPAQALWDICGWTLSNVAFVCVITLDGPICETTFYYSWECVQTMGGATPIWPVPSGGSPTDPVLEPSRDSNVDGRIDDWLDVVGTDDPQAGCVRNGERLGTSYGGPNTSRPTHTGVDIQCDLGDPVYAAITGVVVAFGYLNDECGNGIELKLSSTARTRYCHLSGFPPGLAVGQRLVAGQQVGLCGHSGTATGDHVHVSYWDPNSGQHWEYWNFVNRGPDPFELDSCTQKEKYIIWEKEK